MTTSILADVAASITEFKANPMKVAASADGYPVAVLNLNEPAFHCVPAEAYEILKDKLEDNVITVTVLAIGKRERSDVYNKATAYDATLCIRVWRFANFTKLRGCL